MPKIIPSCFRHFIYFFSFACLVTLTVSCKEPEQVDNRGYDEIKAICDSADWLIRHLVDPNDSSFIIRINLSPLRAHGDTSPPTDEEYYRMGGALLNKNLETVTRDSLRLLLLSYKMTTLLSITTTYESNNPRIASMREYYRLSAKIKDTAYDILTGYQRVLLYRSYYEYYLPTFKYDSLYAVSNKDSLDSIYEASYQKLVEAKIASNKNRKDSCGYESVVILHQKLKDGVTLEEMEMWKMMKRQNALCEYSVEYMEKFNECLWLSLLHYPDDFAYFFATIMTPETTRIIMLNEIENPVNDRLDLNVDLEAIASVENSEEENIERLINAIKTAQAKTN